MINPLRRPAPTLIALTALAALASSNSALARLEKIAVAVQEVEEVKADSPAHRPNDEDEDEPAADQSVMGRGRFMIADENFDQWVFQGRNRGSTREWFDTQLALQLEDVDQGCRLNDAQKAKLKLAARGDIKRFFDLLEEKRRKFQLLKADQNRINEVFQEIQPLQATLQSGPFGQGSIFAKSIRSTLNAEQLADYDKGARERALYRYRARLELVVAMLDGVLGMTEGQRTRLVEALLAETKPPRRTGQYEYYLVLYLAAHVPEEKIRPIFDAAQWKVMSQQLQQAKGFGSWLKQSGLIDEEIGVVAPAPAEAARAKDQ